MTLLGSVWLACSSGEPGTDGRADPPTGDTGTFPVGPPTQIAVDCDPTTNALRFACRVTVAPPHPVEVDWVRTDGVGATRSTTSRGVAGEHEVVVSVLAPEQTYTVRAAAVGWAEPAAEVGVTTSRPPPAFDSWLVVEGAASSPLIGSDLPCNSTAAAAIYDTATGDLVWYEELEWNAEIGLYQMTRFTEDHTVFGLTQTSIVEVDLAGAEVTRLEKGPDYDDLLHHDLFERDGQIWLPIQTFDAGLILDGLLVLDRDGTELARWLPDRYLPIPDDAIGDWLHVNSVFADPAGDVLVSSRTQNSVVAIVGDLGSSDFGEPLWTLAGGPPAGLGSDFALDWSAVPEPHAFAEQHNVGVRRDGRLTLLDSANGRGLVVSVDRGAGTARVDAAYPTAELRCQRQGTATETASGNVVVGCYAGAVREYDVATGGLLWEATPECVVGGDVYGIGSVRWSPLDGW